MGVVQARMTSTRLPGKVLMEIGEGISMLELQLRRLQTAKKLNVIVVATTVNAADQPIKDLCDRLGILCFRGSEMNVLERVCGAAREARADLIVELTGDCPFTDPILVDDIASRFLSLFPKHRYVGNIGQGRTVPWGFDVKAFLTEDVEKILSNSPTPYDCEHVSVRFYDPKYTETYHPLVVKYEGELNHPKLRIELDYAEDYEFLKILFLDLMPTKGIFFSAQDVVRLIQSRGDYHEMAQRFMY